MGVLEYENSDLAKLILRVTVGGLMLFHGVHKLFHGITFIEGVFANAGLPDFLAYGVYLGELVAPLMLILGFRVKLASLLIIILMLSAISLVHLGDVFSLNKHGAWGIELQMFYLLAAVSIFFLGEGRYSLERRETFERNVQ